MQTLITLLTWTTDARYLEVPQCSEEPLSSGVLECRVRAFPITVGSGIHGAGNKKEIMFSRQVQLFMVPSMKVYGTVPVPRVTLHPMTYTSLVGGTCLACERVRQAVDFFGVEGSRTTVTCTFKRIMDVPKQVVLRFDKAYK